MKSIKSRLVLFFSAILFLVSASIGGICYIDASNSLTDNVLFDLQKVGKEAALIIESRNEAEFRVLEETASRTRVSNPQNPQKDRVAAIGEGIERNKYLRIAIVDMNGNAEYSNGTSSDLKDRDYIQKALKGERSISDVIVSKVDGSLVIGYAVPIKYNGAVVGALLAIKDGTFLSGILKDINVGGTSYSYVINEKGIVVGHKDINLVKEQYDSLGASKKDPKLNKLTKLTENMIKREEGKGRYYFKGENKLMGYAPIKATPWTMAVTSPQSESLARLDSLRNSILFATIIILSIGIGMALLIGKQISNPIIKTTNFAKQIAQGDFTGKLPEELLKKKDETGQLANAFSVLTESIRKLISEVIQAAEQVTASSEELTATANQTAMASEEVAKTVVEIAQGASDQARDTEDGSNKVTELGGIIEKDQGYMEEVNIASSEVGKLIEEGLKVIFNLTDKTKESNAAVKEVYEGIVKTSKSSERIGEASSMIASIAGQTNLLALNAAIEAARAGEQGKGFAVVADEIRKLAEKSTESTKIIDQVVKELQENAKISVKTMENVNVIINEQEQSVEVTGNKYKDISDAISKSEEAISKLYISGKGMEEQKNKIMAILENLSAIAQENAAGTEEASASIEEQSASINEIANASQSLVNLAEELQVVISKFKV